MADVITMLDATIYGNRQVHINDTAANDRFCVVNSRFARVVRK